MSDLIPGITVVVPTIPPRQPQLMRALESIQAAAQHWHDVSQLDDTLPKPVRWTSPEQETLEGTFTLAAEVSVDTNHAGAARTRHAGLMSVETELVAFLDDDDEMHAHHLVTLYRAMIEHQADYVWSRFVITYPDGSVLPGPAFLGAKAFAPWNDDDPCQTTITTLVRTELAREAGGFQQFDESNATPGGEMKLIDGQRRGEDHEFTLRCRGKGAVMHHVPEVTWKWHHWGYGTAGQPGNTSGMPERW